METDRGENWIGNYEIEIREPGKIMGSEAHVALAGELTARTVLQPRRVS